MTKKLIAAGLCLALTALLILLVRGTDVAAIGALGTEIGLSGLNGGFHALTGVRMGWFRLTEALGLLAILVVVFFACIGLVQLLRGRSLRRVHPAILTLGGLYAVTGAVYVLFEHVVVNYRPVLMPGELLPEPSFPSSHTMLSCVVFGSAMLLAARFWKPGRARGAILWSCAVLLVLTVAGRLLSGVHWLTDILGGVLLSGALLLLFSAVLDRAVVRGRGARRN